MTLAGIFENLLGFNAELSTQLVSKTTILKWLLERIQNKTHEENRGYAAELISILLQNNRENRLAFGKQDGVETCLKVLSVSITANILQVAGLMGWGQQYRKRDPVDADEAEFMENVFDTLCSALGEPENKKLFLDSEGIDLMVLMMKWVLFCAAHRSELTV